MHRITRHPHRTLPFQALLAGLLVVASGVLPAATAPTAVEGRPPPAPRLSLNPALVQPPQAVVAEAWTSPAYEDDELDSLAPWQDPDGRLWLFATAKRSDRIVVFDAADGARVRESGGPGTAPGRFARPNGVSVAGDLLFVVERDNHRVQVLSLPALEPLAMFGDDVLRVPYGLWTQDHGDGRISVNEAKRLLRETLAIQQVLLEMKLNLEEEAEH